MPLGLFWLACCGDPNALTPAFWEWGWRLVFFVENLKYLRALKSGAISGMMMMTWMIISIKTSIHTPNKFATHGGGRGGH